MVTSVDPKQAAYAAHRARWAAEFAAMEPYVHPDGSPVTPPQMAPRQKPANDILGAVGPPEGS